MRPTGLGGVLGLRVTVGDQPALELARQTAGGQILDTLDMPKQRASAADLQGMIDLAKRVTVVERRCHQTRLETSQVVNEQIDAVGHQRRDPIPGLQTQAAVATGQRWCRPARAPATTSTARSTPARCHQERPRGPLAATRSRVQPQTRAGHPPVASCDRIDGSSPLVLAPHQTQPAGRCFHENPQNSRPVHPSEAGFCSYVSASGYVLDAFWERCFCCSGWF